jgi:hypothetical protein
MRESRNLSAYTKQLISNSLKQYHARKTEQAKIVTRQKQSASMKSYWETIPQGEDINSTIKGCRKTKVVQPIKK